MPKQGYLGAFYSKVLPQVIDNCDENWDAGTHGTPELDTGDKQEGSGSVKIVVASAVADDILATNDFTALDLRNHRRVKFWIKASVNIAAGDLCLLIDETAACAGGPAEEVISLPELVLNTWTEVTLVLAAPADLNAVISVGLEYHLNPQDCNIWIDDINAIGSLVVAAMESMSPATGDGTNKVFQIANANVDLDTLVVQVNAVTVKDYDVTPKGEVNFVTAPGNGLTVKCTYTYWVVVQAGGFHNWAFSLVGDTAERTDFSTTGWKKFVSVLKGWTGSAEKFWLNEKWMAEMGNLIIVKFYEDTGAALERHEGWALITGIDVSAAVDTLIMEPISFQGHGKLSPESG